MQEMQELGLRTDGLISMQEEEMNGAGSAACSLTLGPEGDLMAGVADMGIVESLRPEDVSERGKAGRKAGWPDNLGWKCLFWSGRYEVDSL